MRSTKWFLVAGFIAALLVVTNYRQVNSSIVQPPAGNNGAPNTIPPGQTCGHCHSGGAPQNATPNVDFTFNDGFTSVHIADFEYEPGKTYLISYIALTTSKRYGFQMSALKSGNTNGGTFALTDPTHTTIVSTPTTYVSHHNASSWNQWLFQWTAPATDVGDITFYYVFNASDSSNTDQGDTIYAGQSTIHAAPTGIRNTEAVKNLNIYPNPVCDNLNVSFEMETASPVKLSVYSLDGKLVKELAEEKNTTRFNSTYSLSDLTTGIYLLQIKAGDKLSSRKIVVE